MIENEQFLVNYKKTEDNISLVIVNGDVSVKITEQTPQVLQLEEILKTLINYGNNLG